MDGTGDVTDHGPRDEGEVAPLADGPSTAGLEASASAAEHPAPAHPVAPYPVAPYPVAPYPAAPYPAAPYPVAPYPAGPHPAVPYPSAASVGALGYPGVPPAASSRLSPPARPPHRWGLGAYVVVEAVFLLVSAGLGLVLARSLTTSAGAIALALSIPTLCAAGLAVLITRLRGNGPVVDLGLRVEARDLWIGFTCGLAGLVITIPASILYVAIVGKSATSAVGEVFGGVRADPVTAVLVLLIVVIVAPLCEEVVYRGLLWGAVERLGANRFWALGITTVVFALAHFEFARTPLLLVVAIPIGVARVITGRLPAGIIAHQINNLLPGVVLMLGLLGVVPMT